MLSYSGQTSSHLVTWRLWRGIHLSKLPMPYDSLEDKWQANTVLLKVRRGQVRNITNCTVDFQNAMRMRNEGGRYTMLTNAITVISVRIQMSTQDIRIHFAGTHSFTPMSQTGMMQLPPSLHLHRCSHQHMALQQCALYPISS